MNRMKQVVLLLLVAVGSNAETEPTPTTGPDHCDGPKTIMQLTDLHKLNGEWVMFWSVSDYDHGQKMLSVLRTSHVEINYDNTTFIMTERNLYKSGANRRDFFINITLPSGPGDATVHVDTVTMVEDGTPETYNDTADLTFYESCPDCMRMIYKVKEGQYQLNFMKYGMHRDAEKLKTINDDYRKPAECLGFPLDKPYSYDGVADFAHKKSAPEDPAA